MKWTWHKLNSWFTWVVTRTSDTKSSRKRNAHYKRINWILSSIITNLMKLQEWIGSWLEDFLEKNSGQISFKCEEADGTSFENFSPTSLRGERIVHLHSQLLTFSPLKKTITKHQLISTPSDRQSAYHTFRAYGI